MIEIINSNKTFSIGKPSEFCALKDINLLIEKGEMVAIIGKSGAGKSTLLHIIGCIDSFDEGSVFLFDGNDINLKNDKEKAKIRNKKIGIVFQDFALVSDFTVYENIEIPLILAHIKKSKRKVMISNALDKVGLSGYENKDINILSGGEKQRVAIARAIVNEPDLILADEPTGALDTKTGEATFKLLNEINKNGKTVIIITHDMDIAKKCPRIIEIKDGRIVSEKTRKVI